MRRLSTFNDTNRHTIVRSACERRPAVPEEHVIGIWLRAALPARVFTGSDGAQLRVLHPGERNRHDGPDFLEASVLRDGVLRRGAIEVHTREGDWQRHGHDTDARYDDVVLHVCLYAESSAARRRPAVGPPTLILGEQLDRPLREVWAEARPGMRGLPCRRPAVVPPRAEAEAMLQVAAALRLERKCRRMQLRQALLARTQDDAAAFRQLVYEAMARACGYGGNEDVMERLARAVPLRELASLPADTRHARFCAAAGLHASAAPALIDSLAWRASAVMPRNRAGRRLGWFAAWLPALEEPDWWRRVMALLVGRVVDPDAFLPLFAVPGRKDNPGRDRVFECAVNVLAPALLLHARTRGREDLERAAAALYYSCAPAPGNRHVRMVAETFEFTQRDAGQQQGMIELHRAFCLPSRCGSCFVGTARPPACPPGEGVSPRGKMS